MKEKVLDILEEICGTDEVRENLDVDLFESGLLDSLGTIELILQFQEKLSISIQPTEIQREDIKTPNKIIELISKRV